MGRIQHHELRDYGEVLLDLLLMAVFVGDGKTFDVAQVDDDVYK